MLPEETLYLGGDKVDNLYFLIKGEIENFAH
jgi:hypothetical protein